MWGMFFYVNKIEFRFKYPGLQEGLDGAQSFQYFGGNMDVVHIRQFRNYYVFFASSEVPNIRAIARNVFLGRYDDYEFMYTEMPVSAMTTVVSKTRPAHYNFLFNPEYKDYLISSYNDPSTSQLYIFEILFEEQGYDTTPNGMTPPKLEGDIYIKMAAIYNESADDLRIYSITRSKKLVRSNLTEMDPPKNLVFLGPASEIKAVEFIEYVDFAVICADSGICSIFDYIQYDETNPTNNLRSINVGKGFSKISLNQN